MRAWRTERRGIRRAAERTRGRPGGACPLHRPPRLARRQRLLPLAVRIGRRDDDRRRRRMVDGDRRPGELERRRAFARRSSRPVDFPHSLGLFYSAFTDLLGFEVNEGEYKVMGMAPYGEPRYRRQSSSGCSTSYDDGSFWLDLSYFSFHYSTRQAYTDEAARAARRRAAAPERALLDAGGRGRLAGTTSRGASATPTSPRASRRSPNGRSSTSPARRTQRDRLAEPLLRRRRRAERRSPTAGSSTRRPFERALHPARAGRLGRRARRGALRRARHARQSPRRTELEHAYWGSEYDDERRRRRAPRPAAASPIGGSATRRS